LEYVSGNNKLLYENVVNENVACSSYMDMEAMHYIVPFFSQTGTGSTGGAHNNNSFYSNSLQYVVTIVSQSVHVGLDVLFISKCYARYVSIVYIQSLHF